MQILKHKYLFVSDFHIIIITYKKQVRCRFKTQIFICIWFPYSYCNIQKASSVQILKHKYLFEFWFQYIHRYLWRKITVLFPFPETAYFTVFRSRTCAVVAYIERTSLRVSTAQPLLTVVRYTSLRRTKVRKIVIVRTVGTADFRKRVKDSDFPSKIAVFWWVFWGKSIKIAKFCVHIRIFFCTDVNSIGT